MVKIPASSAEGTPSIPDQGIKILNAEQWSQKLKKKKGAISINDFLCFQ